LAAQEWVKILRQRSDFYKKTPEAVEAVELYAAGDDEENEKDAAVVEDEEDAWAATVAETVRRESIIVFTVENDGDVTLKAEGILSEADTDVEEKTAAGEDGEVEIDTTAVADTSFEASDASDAPDALVAPVEEAEFDVTPEAETPGSAACAVEEEVVPPTASGKLGKILLQAHLSGSLETVVAKIEEGSSIDQMDVDSPATPADDIGLKEGLYVNTFTLCEHTDDFDCALFSEPLFPNFESPPPVSPMDDTGCVCILQ
jgi:hypothetical protein